LFFYLALSGAVLGLSIVGIAENIQYFRDNPTLSFDILLVCSCITLMLCITMQVFFLVHFENNLIKLAIVPIVNLFGCFLFYQFFLFFCLDFTISNNAHWWAISDFVSGIFCLLSVGVINYVTMEQFIKD